MIIIMNGIEYTTSVSDGITKVTQNKDKGCYTGPLSETDALKEYILNPIRQQREEVFLKEGWRVHSANYPYDDQQEWIDYFTLLRDLPDTYVEGQDIVLPRKP